MYHNQHKHFTQLKNQMTYLDIFILVASLPLRTLLRDELEFHPWEYNL